MYKLSIITINLNNEIGLKNTLESISLQNLSNIEVIVIDGGSKDGSVKVIDKHKNLINYSISGIDSGIYNAMNKGIQKAKGEYLLFLNSGDYFIDENILENVSKEIDGTDLIYGNIKMVEPSGKSWIGIYPNKLSVKHFFTGSLPHPATFIKKSLFDKVGLYDENLKICSDWKFFLSAVIKYEATYKHIDKTIAVFHLDGLSSDKGSGEIISQEKEKVIFQEYPLLLTSFFQARNESLQRRNKNIFISLKKFIKSILLHRL